MTESASKASKKREAQGKTAQKRGSKSGNKKLNKLLFFNWLKSEGFQLEETWYAQKMLPNVGKDDQGNLAFAPNPIPASRAIFKAVRAQLISDQDINDWDDFTKKYGIGNRREKTRDDLIANSTGINRQVTKQGETGYFVRVPNMLMWYGEEASDDSLPFVNIRYNDGNIVITKSKAK